MGEVYKADDLRLGQPVALKFLPASLAEDPKRVARLTAEVRIARQISHRSVCRVYDLGEAAGLHFLSMEYVDGEDLASLLRRIGRLPQDKAVELARQICAGLAAAHECGVLHRDLKPQNVMIDGQGRARLADFGLAVLAAELAPGESGGTPLYMSPEQLAGRAVSVKSDLYSLGLVLYEMFTGKRAFSKAPLADLVRQRSESHPSRPSEHVPELDPKVERVILRCLEKDPAARPNSALAVAAGLPGGDPLAEALAAGQTPSPEMVAAAGEEGILSPLAALRCFVSALALVALFYAFGARIALPLYVPLSKPPEVLAERAREILRTSGHTAMEADAAYGFVYDEAYLGYLERHDPSPRRWDALATGRPAAMRFWYRQSPEPMESGGRFGRVSLADPPLTLAGMASVQLDTQGRLLELRVVPPARTFDAAQQPSLLPALIAAAGLDLSTLHPAKPSFAPPVFADARAAWEGRFPEAAPHPLQVEGAELLGRPVFFRVLGPWHESLRPSSEPRSPRAAFLHRLSALGFLVVGAVWLAWRNLRRGRGDRTGARRLAVYAFGSNLAAWLLAARHSPDPGREWTLFSNGLMEALYIAGLVWLFYLAIEPAIRRRWPGSLTSWSRLLSGRLRDPLVGRDVLVGSLAIWAFFPIAVLALWFATALGSVPPRPPIPTSLDSLLGSRLFVAKLLTDQVSVVYASMFFLLLFLLLRALVRRAWVALLALVLIMVAVGGRPGVGLTGMPLVEGALVAVLLGGISFVLVRFGLLALMVMFYFRTLEIMPTWDLTAWYAASSRIGLAVFLLLTSYGFVTALAGRPLFKRGLLED
jgi:serine/threonine-protein kinase